MVPLLMGLTLLIQLPVGEAADGQDRGCLGAWKSTWEVPRRVRVQRSSKKVKFLNSDRTGKKWTRNISRAIHPSQALVASDCASQDASILPLELLPLQGCRHAGYFFLYIVNYHRIIHSQFIA